MCALPFFKKFLSRNFSNISKISLERKKERNKEIIQQIKYKCCKHKKIRQSKIYT